MANTPFANKNSNTKELYKSRETYEEFYPTDIDQFDLWNNLPLYGRVNEEGTPVFPNESKLLCVVLSEPVWNLTLELSNLKPEGK